MSLSRVVRWSIAIRKLVNVLDSTWIDDIPICRWLILADTNWLEGKHVSDLLHANGGWNVEFLLHYFHEQLVCRITSIDWYPTEQQVKLNLRKLSIRRSVTTLAYESQFPNSWVFPMAVQPQVAPNRKIFLLVIVKDVVPTNIWLHRCGLRDQLSCPWGCNEDEDMNHNAVTVCLHDGPPHP